MMLPDSPSCPFYIVQKVRKSDTGRWTVAADTPTQWHGTEAAAIAEADRLVQKTQGVDKDGKACDFVVLTNVAVLMYAKPPPRPIESKFIRVK